MLESHAQRGFGMRGLWAFVILAASALAQSQTDAKSPQTLADLGLAYPLSRDWILATTLIQRQAAAQTPPPAGTVLLAAVYVPEKKALSESSPFFSLLAYRETHPDCKQVLDSVVVQLQKQDKRIKSMPQRFSVGSNDFYRTDFEQKGVLKQRSFICTALTNYVLVWNAGARDEKGLETVISTLNGVSPAVTTKPANSVPNTHAPKQPEQASSVPHQTKIQSGVMSGRLVKKVNPVYPPEARSAYIQGTVMLMAIISKEGDIVNLEVTDGPIELAGSAVDAVRRWKYLPYTRNGEPIAVQTAIQVNYQLR